MAVAVPASTILPIRLAIWVTTRATRDEIGTIVERTAGETALSVRVRAIPEKGKANFAVCALIAKQLKLPKTAIRVASGTTSRLKILEILVQEHDQIRIQSLIGQWGKPRHDCKNN